MEAEESVSLQHGEDNCSLSLCCWQVHLPFAVVGSTEEVKIGNKMAKARQYPWGVVQGTCASRGRASSCVTPRVAVPAGFGQVLDVGRWKGGGRVLHLAVMEARKKQGGWEAMERSGCRALVPMRQPPKDAGLCGEFRINSCWKRDLANKRILVSPLSLEKLSSCFLGFFLEIVFSVNI